MIIQSGDQIIFNNAKEIFLGGTANLINGCKYLVLKIDEDDNLPCIEVNDSYYFLVELDMEHIEYVSNSKLSLREIADRLDRQGYIPPSKEVDNLMIKLTFNNLMNTYI